MEHIWPTMTAVLGANMLTIMFLAGLYRTTKRQLDTTTVGALLVPLFFGAAGLYLFG